MNRQPGIVGDLRPDLTAFRAILALSPHCTPALESGQTAALTIAGGVYDACSDTFVRVVGWWNRNAPPTNAGRKLPPEPLTAAEVQALVAAASNRSSSGIRQRAMIGVMYGAGLRLAELLDLSPRDVDTAAGIVRVRNGKGRKTRVVGLDTQGGALLDRWLDRRKQHELNGRHPIFAQYSAGKVGQPIQQRYVRLALARLAERAGIDKRVHPHGLRHSLAYDLAQRGVPTHQIQAQLGHGSLAVTDRYVRHLLPADMIAVMRDRQWGDQPHR